MNETLIEELEVLDAIFEAEPDTIQKIDDSTLILTIKFDQFDFDFCQTFLKFLPSIRLTLSVPENYPEEQALDILVLEGLFLTNAEKRSLVQQAIENVYDEGCPMIYELYEFIKNFDFIAENYLTPEKISKFEKYDVFLNYNEFRLKQQFDEVRHTCGVCWSDLHGNNCVYNTACSDHIYCRNCAIKYLKSKIEERDLSVTKPIPKCMDPSCDKVIVNTIGKIQDLVGNELFARYNEILTESFLLEDEGQVMYYCPRPACKSPITLEAKIKDAEGNLIENSDVYNIRCGNCPYIYCGLCNNTAHQPPCQIKKLDMEKIMAAYENKDNRKIKEYEKKYGTSIKNIIDSHLSEKLVKSISKTCPNCKVATTKIEGCNKMICRFCNAPWCWLCGKNLKNYKSPYHHFNPILQPKSECANRLFDGIETAGENFGDIDLNEQMMAWEIFR